MVESMEESMKRTILNQQQNSLAMEACLEVHCLEVHYLEAPYPEERFPEAIYPEPVRSKTTEVWVVVSAWVEMNM